MTEYGLRVRNLAGEVQIDSHYRNYLLEKSGSISNLSGLTSAISIESNPEPPVALVRPTSASDRFCGVFDVSFSGGKYTGVRFFGGGNPATKQCSFDYKIFTLRETKSEEEYGLRVYDVNEDLVFDSGVEPLKILQAGTATIGTTFTHNNHEDPYYIFSPWHSGMHGFSPGPPQQGPRFRRLAGIARVSNKSCVGGWVVYQVGITNHSFDVSSGTSFTLILCR